MPLVRSGNGHYFSAGTAPGTIRHGGRDVRPDASFFERPRAVVATPVARADSSFATTTPRDLPDGEYTLGGGFKLQVMAGRATLTNGSHRADLTDVSFRPDTPMGEMFADGKAGVFRWILQRGDAGHVGGGRYEFTNPNIVLKYSFAPSQPLQTITWAPRPA